VKIFSEMLKRLSRARVWVALQFGLTLVLILAGIAWTRLPEKHGWQVALTLLIPLLLAICVLELEAGTLRKLADDDGKPKDDRLVKLVWGAVSLVVWLAVIGAAWALLDWGDDHIWQWAAYLNSKMGAKGRARVFTFEHIQHWLTILEWVLRWVVVPAKVLPWAGATAQWGWRVPVRRVLGMLWNWRWWAGVVVAALLGVYLPGRFFSGAPTGAVSHQVWAVILKLAGSYLLAIASWVLLLGWWATLFCGKRPEGGAEPPDGDALLPVPVLAGPPDRELRAKAVSTTEDGTV
jgi:hypothetical protein